MKQYEKEFKEIIDHAQSNKISKIIFQNRNSGSQILMNKLGDIIIYNDSYEKDHIKNIVASIYEKYTSKKFNENEMHLKTDDFNFKGITLEYHFTKTYPSGFDFCIMLK